MRQQESSVGDEGGGGEEGRAKGGARAGLERGDVLVPDFLVEPGAARVYLRVSSVHRACKRKRGERRRESKRETHSMPGLNDAHGLQSRTVSVMTTWPSARTEQLFVSSSAKQERLPGGAGERERTEVVERDDSAAAAVAPQDLPGVVEVEVRRGRLLPRLPLVPPSLPCDGAGPCEEPGRRGGQGCSARRDERGKLRRTRCAAEESLRR